MPLERLLVGLVARGVLAALIAAAPGVALILLVLANTRPGFGAPADSVPTASSVVAELAMQTMAEYLLWTAFLTVLLKLAILVLLRNTSARTSAAAAATKLAGQVDQRSPPDTRGVVVAALAFPVSFVLLDHGWLFGKTTATLVWAFDLFGRSFSNSRAMTYLEAVLPWALPCAGAVLLYAGLMNAVRTLIGPAKPGGKGFPLILRETNGPEGA